MIDVRSWPFSGKSKHQQFSRFLNYSGPQLSCVTQPFPKPHSLARYPRIPFKNKLTYVGRVESVALASGTQFSLLPPENATGNFTKITQRYTVRVSLSADVAAKLVPGLSVTVTVDSRDTGK